MYLGEFLNKLPIRNEPLALIHGSRAKTTSGPTSFAAPDEQYPVGAKRPRAYAAILQDEKIFNDDEMDPIME